MKTDFDPPQACNEHGATIMSDGMQGNWKQQDKSLILIGYRESRKTVLTEVANSIYLSKESNYPEDKQYKYDSLDSIKFKMD
jgi:hypothetical protein